MHRAISRLLRLFGYRRTFGGAVVSTRYLDQRTSFPVITDEEAEDFKEMMRIDRASVYASFGAPFASDEDAALWFRGEKTW